MGPNEQISIEQSHSKEVCGNSSIDEACVFWKLDTRRIKTKQSLGLSLNWQIQKEWAS
jgi:hypothetical protein